jgi:hypothetical protein
MASQKLMRCEIRPRGSNAPGSPRYIPLEIFGLWEYLMTTKHDFEVNAAHASLWLDLEDEPEAAYGEHEFERVTEVTAFVFSGRDDMFTGVRRYFATEECQRLKSIFLKHYQSPSDTPETQVRERPGIWVRREKAAVTADR